MAVGICDGALTGAAQDGQNLWDGNNSPAQEGHCMAALPKRTLQIWKSIEAYPKIRKGFCREISSPTISQVDSLRKATLGSMSPISFAAPQDPGGGDCDHGRVQSAHFRIHGDHQSPEQRLVEIWLQVAKVSGISTGNPGGRFDLERHKRVLDFYQQIDFSAVVCAQVMELDRELCAANLLHDFCDQG
jgi:hypothetical protein